MYRIRPTAVEPEVVASDHPSFVSGFALAHDVVAWPGNLSRYAWVEAGRAFLTPPMTGHGPRAEVVVPASLAGEAKPTRLATDSLWFQIASPFPMVRTPWGSRKRVHGWRARRGDYTGL